MKYQVRSKKGVTLFETNDSERAFCVCRQVGQASDISLFRGSTLLATYSHRKTKKRTPPVSRYA